jgi:signal transduction histidine kinase
VTIQVGTHRDAIVGEIVDDGSGLPADRCSPNMDMGLDSTGERLHKMGGIFEVTSARGKGTSIHFEIPLTPDFELADPNKAG